MNIALESDVNLVVNKSSNNIPSIAVTSFDIVQRLIYQTGLDLPSEL
jgi:hypothetical protein